MSHFRSNSFAVDQTSLFDFTFFGQQSWRWSAFSNSPVGTIVTNYDTLYFGDGAWAQIYLKIIAVDAAADYMVAEIVDAAGNPIQHSYASAGAFEAFFESNARIATDDAWSNSNYRGEVVVNPGILNEAPVSAVPPIVQVADNSLFSFQIPGFDPDGDPLTFRIGNASEFISSGQSESTLVAPGGVTLSSSGLLTWDVRDVGGAAVSAGQRYTMTAMIGDGKTSTPVDFILEIVSTSNNQAPSFTLVPPTQNLTIGQTVNLAVVATDPNGNLSTIQVLNPPAGMITDFHPSHGELHIDYTAVAGGTYVVTVQATDAGGLTAQTSITFNVAVNRAPDAVDDQLGGGGGGDLAIVTPYANEGQVVSNGLAALARFDSITILTNTANPSLSGFESVISFSNTSFSDPVTLGNVLADFVDAGGHLVVATYALTQPWWIQGRLTQAGYMPLLPTANSGTSPSGSLVATDPDHPIFSNLDLAALSGTFFVNSNYGSAPLPPGATLLATDGDGLNMIAVNAAGNVYATNLFPAFESASETMYWQLFANMASPAFANEDGISIVRAADLLANDSDPDGDALTITGVSATSASGGSVILNDDGTISYDPRAALNSLTAGQKIEDSFTYTVSDGHGGTDTATVRFDVVGMNDAATIAGIATGDVREDATLTATGTLTIADVDTGEAEVRPIAAGTAGANGYGTFQLLANGQWTYTLNNQNAAVQALPATGTLTDTILATSEDGTDTQLITVTITGTNDVATIAGVAAGTVQEDATLVATGTLTIADIDTGEAEVRPIAAGTPGSAGYGTFELLANGQWTYTLNNQHPGVQNLAANDSVTDSITATSEDGTDTQVITVTIRGINDAPLARADNYKFSEDQTFVATVSVLGNDSDSDNDAMMAILTDGPDHAASFSFNADGTFTYTPVGDYFGVDSFSYRPFDGQLFGNIVTVTLRIDPTQDVPVGYGETYNVVEDTTLAIPATGVVGNDVDVDGDALAAVLVGGPGHAAAFTLNADGSFSYTPAANFTGLDSFSYRPSDGIALGNIVTVNLNVVAEEDAAVARNDAFQVSEGGFVGGNLFADNGAGPDSDPDSQLMISAVNGDTLAVGRQILLPSGALLTVNANGSFSYSPNGAFNSLTSPATGAANLAAQDLFTYSLAGGGTATVAIGVNGLRTIDDQLIGSAGNDLITDAGFNYNDTFLLQQGGDDSASGLGGNDGFYFGSALTTLDSVNGGAGIDSVALQGNYSALVLGNIVNVETLVPLAGNDARFGDLAGNVYDYDVTTNDANVAAGATLTVIGSNLRDGEDLVFNGAAETDGSFRIFAGQGDDRLIGGAGNDGFFFGADGNLDGQDVVIGGGGVDSLALRGNYVGANAIAFQNGSMSGVEVLTFLSGHTNEFGGAIDLAGFDYAVTMADGNLLAGQRLDVAAGNLRANESLSFDGRLETDGSFRIVSGAGDDVLRGGSGNDVLYGALGADVLQGDGGADTYLYRFASESTAAVRDRIVWDAGDRIDLGLVDANANTAANDGFSFIGSGAFTGVAGQLRVSDAAGSGLVEGDVNGDGIADLVLFVDGYVPLVTDFVL